MQELWKIIIALVAVILSLLGLFGWFVKRWIVTTDASIKELYGSRNVSDIALGVRQAVCEERHKEKKK